MNTSRSLKTKNVGNLAGGVSRSAPGPFNTPAGARANDTANHETRAPERPGENTLPHAWWILPGAIFGLAVWITICTLIGNTLWSAFLWLAQ